MVMANSQGRGSYNPDVLNREGQKLQDITTSTIIIMWLTIAKAMGHTLTVSFQSE